MKEKIERIKENINKTVMIGDLTFCRIKDNGGMALVTAVNGRYIGQICNQVNLGTFGSSKLHKNDASEVEQKL